MRAGVRGPGGGVAGMGVDQPAGLGCHRRPAPPAADAAGDPVQVGEGGVAFGVHDGVHVFGPADHPQLGDALVGGDDQLQAGPARLHQPLTRLGVAGPAGPVDGLVGLGGDRTVQP